MKLQEYIGKVEELKALTELYGNTQAAAAKARAAADALSVIDEVPAEDKEKVADQLAEIDQRLAALVDLMGRRTNTLSIDDAVEAVQRHIARIEQYQETRREQLQLRTELDIALHMNAIPVEKRREVEAHLEGLQTRLNGILDLAAAAFPTSLIALV